MCALEEERYREQVRHELEEERFRADVRKELETRPPGPSAKHVGDEPAGKASQLVRDGEQFVWGKGAAPVPEPVSQPVARPLLPRPGRPGIWWLLASLLLVAGITLVIVALLQRSGSAAGASLELALTAGGPIAELRPPDWRPEDLATDDYVISPDGAVTSRPGRGLATFEDWKAAFETPPPVMERLFPEELSLAELQARYRTNPPDPALPRMRLAAGASTAPTTPATPDPVNGVNGEDGVNGVNGVDEVNEVNGIDPSAIGDVGASMSGLLRFVPARSWIVVGLDKARLAGSPTLSRLRDLLARGLGETSPLSTIGGSGLLSEASELVYASALDRGDGGDPDDEFIVVGTTSQGERIRELAVAAGARLDDGVLTSLVLPGGQSVLLEPGRFAAARGMGPAMLAARASGGMLSEGTLSSMLLRVAPRASVFVVMRVQAAQTTDLNRLITGLGRAEVLGATIEVGAQVGATLHLTFPDAVTATDVLAGFENKRAELVGSPEGVMLRRVVVSLEGARVTLALNMSEAELAGLFAGAGLEE